MTIQRTPRLGTSASRPLRLIGLVVSAICMAGVIWWASRQEAPTFPAGASELAALAGAICVYGLATALRAERWRSLLAREGGRAGRPDAYALTTVGFMGNNVLPARAGDAMRVYLMAPRSDLRMRDVLGTLIAERLLDVWALIGLFAFLAYGLLRGIDTPGGDRLEIFAAAVVGVLAAGALVLHLARHTSRGRAAIELMRPLASSTARLRGRNGAVMSVLTIAIWASEATCYLLVGRSIGIELTAAESAYLIAVAGVFVLVPSGPGYVGTLDAAVLFGLEAVGEVGGAALSYLIMLRFALLVPITVLGAALLLTRYGGLRAEHLAVEKAPR